MSILLNNGIDKNIVTFDLRSPEAIAKMNGTIAGSPTFSRDGIKLDGTNDEITFNLSNTLLSMPKLTISVDFIPEFNLDDGNAYHIFDTDSASRCYLLKNNVGNFQIGWNGVNLTTISKATYSSYWKENEMNKLLVSTESGVLNVYLNNNLIANSSPTWTPASPVTLYVGRSNAGIYHFKGTIKSISFKNDLSTEGEVSDLYDNSTFNFQNKADIWLDMANQTSDGTNAITKDKSGQGNDFKLGDGTTSIYFPAFKNPGFEFDSSNDYLLNDNASGILNNTYQTFVICFKPNFSPTDGTQNFFFDTLPSLKYAVLKQTTNSLYCYIGDGFSSTDYTKFYNYWNTNGLNVLVITDDTTSRNIYLNGVLVDTPTSTVTPSDVTDLYVGMRQNNTGNFNGIIYHFSTYGKKFNQKMTPTQVRALTSQLFNTYSN